MTRESIYKLIDRLVDIKLDIRDAVIKYISGSYGDNDIVLDTRYAPSFKYMDMDFNIRSVRVDKGVLYISEDGKMWHYDGNCEYDITELFVAVVFTEEYRNANEYNNPIK